MLDLPSLGMEETFSRRCWPIRSLPVWAEGFIHLIHMAERLEIVSHIDQRAFGSPS